MEVTTAALAVPDGWAGLEGSVGLVQTEREELVLHVVLRHPGRRSQDARGDGGQGTVLDPGNFVELSVGGRTHHVDINIRLATVGTVAPLALTSHVDPVTVSEYGTPGDPIIGIHKGAGGVLLVLVEERKHTGRPSGSTAYSDAARGRFWIHRSDLNADIAALGAADPPRV